MIRGFLGVVVVVGFFDQTFGFWVLEYLVWWFDMCMVFWVCCSKNNTTWVVGWFVVGAACDFAGVGWSCRTRFLVGASLL